ncbi:MAG: alpha/beta fold hydrolase [Actinomycetota bacterium]
MELERRRFVSSGGDIAYADEGEGPAVVLLHGLPTSAHLWRDLVPILAPRFRAVAPDLLGYGASEKSPDGALDIRAQAGYVRELLADLGISEFAVVAHDIGGGIAQLLAFEGGVKTLVLIDSISFDSWPIEGVKMIQGADDAQVDEVFAENLMRAIFDLGMGHPERLSAEDFAAYLAPWRKEPLALVRAARGVDGVGLVGTEGRLSSLDAPAFIIWGEDDAYQPSELAEGLGEAIPGSSVALLPGCGHYVTEDAPETVFPMISEFLRIQYLKEPHRHGTETVEVSIERPEPRDGEA